MGSKMTRRMQKKETAKVRKKASRKDWSKALKRTRTSQDPKSWTRVGGMTSKRAKSKAIFVARGKRFWMFGLTSQSHLS